MRNDRLRLLRESMGYTQSEFAERLDMGTRQIWRYENGETEPSAETLGRIAKFLNVTADYLLGLTDDPRPIITVEDLSPKEVKVLNALRGGDDLEAIRIIVEAAK